MGRRRRGRRRALVALIAVLVFAQLTVIASREAHPPPPFSWILEGVPALAGWLRSGGEAIGAAWRTYWANVDAARRLRILEAENERLRFALWWSRRQARVRAAVDAAMGWVAPPWRGAVGRVVWHDPEERYEALWIELDRSRPVLGHAVVVAEVLLGRVVRVEGRFAQVLLVQDVESAVDVVATHSGVRGILRGTGGGEGRLAYVPAYAPLTVGEPLVTTGRDTVFPEGLPVGEVAAVERDPDALHLEARVRFYADPTTVAWVRTLPVPQVPR